MAVIALNIDSAAQIYEKKTFVKIFTPIAKVTHDTPYVVVSIIFVF